MSSAPRIFRGHWLALFPERYIPWSFRGLTSYSEPVDGTAETAFSYSGTAHRNVQVNGAVQVDVRYLG